MMERLMTSPPLPRATVVDPKDARIYAYALGLKRTKVPSYIVSPCLVLDVTYDGERAWCQSLESVDPTTQDGRLMTRDTSLDRSCYWRWCTRLAPWKGWQATYTEEDFAVPLR